MLVLPKGDGPHILIFDIESTPIPQWRWTAGKDDGRALRVDDDSYLLTVAYQWLGEQKVHVIHNNGHRDDLFIVAAVWDLLDAADIVMAHNGKGFDVPKMNTRFFALDMGPPSPYQQIDTLQIARQKFAHHSNTLDALARLAGTELKKSNRGIALWFDCMEGNKAAIKEMADYNKGDVVALRDLYLHLLPWIDRHPNVAQWQKGQFACTNCGSQDLQKRGIARTRVSEFQRYLCNKCGFHPRERRSFSQKDRLDRTMLT